MPVSAHKGSTTGMIALGTVSLWGLLTTALTGPEGKRPASIVA